MQQTGHQLLCRAGVELAIEAAGGVKSLADAAGVHISAVSQWRARGRIGLESLSSVARATGLTRQALRPDLYGDVQ